MKASVRKKEGNVCIVDLAGEVDFHSVESFRTACMRDFIETNVIFNMKDLQFVGSDGLSSFMQTMGDLKQYTHLKLCCVSSEFSQLFANHYTMKHMDIYQDEQSAVIAFHSANA